MSDTTEIGVLLLDQASGSQVGFIQFDASGMLVYKVIKMGLHVFAFKPIDQLLNGQWTHEPLYKKHASLLDENKKLPREILEQEANSCADFLNRLESAPMLGSHMVKAQVVDASSKRLPC